MRPIKLEIEGLHSFESKQVIDFKSLSNKNIFGIFGQTGSGKSTILDAIVLALYGKVQRSKTNSDFINTKCKKTVINYTFSFKAEGEEKVYTINRVFKKKVKDNGVDQVAEILEVGAFGSHQIMEGANKVDKFIANLFGMTDTEFLKCVALPQGEFAAFLKAKPNERISIIGNIFDLNKYGEELWEKVKNRCEALETEKAVLNGKLTVLGTESKEGIDRSKEIYEKKVDEKNKIEAELALKTKIEKEEREVVVLSTELNEVCEKIAECKEISASIDFKKEALMRAKKLSDNVYLIDREQELTKLILTENDEIYKLNDALEAENNRLNQFEAESSLECEELKGDIELSTKRQEELNLILPIEQEVDKQKEQFANLKNDKSIIEKNIETLSRKLSNKKLDKSIINNELLEINEKIAKLKESLSNYDSLLAYTALSKYTEELRGYQKFADVHHSDAILLLSTAISNIDSAKKEEQEIVYLVKSLQQKYTKKANGKEPYMLNKKDEIEIEHEKFLVFKQKVENLENEQIKIIKNINAQENFKAQKQEEKIELDEKYKEIYEDILVLKNKEQELLNKKLNTVSENGLANLIKKVKIGEICPICKNEVLEKNVCASIDLIVIENDIDSLQKNIEVKEEKKEAIVYKLARVVSTIEAIDKEIENLTQESEEIKNNIMNIVKDYTGIVVPDVQQKINELETDILNKKDQIMADYKQEIAYFKKLQEIKESIVKNNVISLMAKEQSQMFNELYNTISFSIKNKDNEMLSIVSEGDDFATKIEEMKNINIDLEQALNKKDALNSKLLALTDEILSQETTLAVLLEQKKNNIETSQNVLEDIKAKESRVGLVVTGSVQEAIEIVKIDIQNKRHRIEELDKLKKERQESLSQLKNRLTELVVANNTHNEEHSLVAVRLQAILNELGLLSIEEAKPFVLEKDEIIAMENAIIQYETKFKHYIKRKEELEQKLNGRISADAILNQLSIEIIQIKERLEDLNNEIITLGYDIKIREQKLNEILLLTRELDVVNKKYDAAKELYTAIKGKALLEFIAEEYIDDISFMASSKLQVLMDGRYELKYSDREFFVLDNFNDGALRPVSTLSGGELFVVSLALALSISDAIISKSNKTMDFFFLDEGFGTLDKEYCEYVVDSLMKLTSENLTVGLISHIPELQERISEKIYITKTSNGSVIKNISSI